MSVDTIATHQVAGPIAFVNISIGVDELSIPARLITAPDSTISRAIWPLHGALTVAHTPKPLSLILSTSRIILIVLKIFAINEVFNFKLLRVGFIFCVLACFSVDFMAETDCLPVFFPFEIWMWVLFIMLFLSFQMILKPSICYKTTHARLQLGYFVPISPIKLSIVDMTMVLC